MTWNQPVGYKVDAVRAALDALDTGLGDYEDVVAAMQEARFAVRPTALSLDELAANWEYQPMVDTFTDTVQTALFAGTITQSQYNELSGMAQFVSPEPSRVRA